MEETPDLEQLGKIINAVKTARMIDEAIHGTSNSGTSTEDKKIGDEEAPEDSAASGITLCAFDRELQSPAIRSIKAAIPYLDRRYQKNMGIIVKLMEMDILLNNYTVLAAENGEDKSRQMLLAIRSELPEPNRYAADLLMKIMEIINISANMAMQNQG